MVNISKKGGKGYVYMGAIIVYIVALLWLVQFKIFLLLDFKMMFMVVLGTFLLTLAGYSKGVKWNQMKEKARWNASVSGYLAAFILIFSQFSTSIEYDNILYEVALNLRPLLYGLVLQILLSGEEERKEKDKNIQGDENMGSMGSMENMENMENMESMENIHVLKSIEKMTEEEKVLR